MSIWKHGQWPTKVATERNTSKPTQQLPSPRCEQDAGRVIRYSKVRDFWFHDLRQTFATWYMMNDGDRYEIAKLSGHANIKMTDRCAKLAREHISRTGDTAKLMWGCLGQ